VMRKARSHRVVNSVTAQRHMFAQSPDGRSILHSPASSWSPPHSSRQGGAARARNAPRLAPRPNPSSRHAVLTLVCRGPLRAMRSSALLPGRVASGGCWRGDAAVRRARSLRAVNSVTAQRHARRQVVQSILNVQPVARAGDRHRAALGGRPRGGARSRRAPGGRLKPAICTPCWRCATWRRTMRSVFKYGRAARWRAMRVLNPAMIVAGRRVILSWHSYQQGLADHRSEAVQHIDKA
jgi:hypothetical protein